MNNQLTPKELLARTLFAETKNPEDAMAIASVILNRMKRPKRFGGTLEDVIYAPNQFSGVNSNEWKKIESGKLTPEEKQIYSDFQQIAEASIMGMLEDPTGGADHYFNPKIVKPKWSNKMKKTYNTNYHEYYKE